MKKLVLSIILILAVVFSTTGAPALASDEHGDSGSGSNRGQSEESSNRSRTTDINGTITSLSLNRIRVDGKTIRLNRETTVLGKLAVGAQVVVKAIRTDESLVARTITVVTPGTTPPPPPPPTVPPPPPTPVNHSPVLSAIGSKAVTTGVLLTFTVSGSDPDGDALTYSASNLPSGAAFNAATRVFSWTPGAAQTGSYPAVHFQVSDGTLIASEDITITVAAAVQPPPPPPPPVNQPPVLSAIGNRSVNEGQPVTITISATDPDGDALTYSASNLPSGATFNAATRVFSWTPSFTQAGSYAAVHFQVSDGSLTDSEDITVTVVNVNRAPVLGAIGSKSVNTGTALTFTLAATDPDGDALTYSASNLPSGAAFNAATRVFSWTPGTAQAGSYPLVHFQVSDGSLTDSEDITITVAAAVQLVSFSATIQPMFNQACNGCHPTAGVSLSTHAEISARANNLGMGSSRLTAAQKTTLANWVSQGMPNN